MSTEHHGGIDEICCTFLQIPVSQYKVFTKEGKQFAGLVDADRGPVFLVPAEEQDKYAFEPVYPPVSTDPYAHDMLVSKLNSEMESRGWTVNFDIQSASYGRHNNVAIIAAKVDCNTCARGFGSADSIAKAFAMAVAELSRQFEVKKEEGL